MGLSHSPSLVLPGLTLCLDAANTKSILSAVEVLVVAGGGGGGMDMGGGGGGGGVIYSSAVSITPGSAITATVGNGGVGAPAAGTNGQPGGHQYTIPATQGGNSVFGALTAIGGGFGGSSYRGYTPGIAGGSGGSGGGASGYNDNAGTFNGGTGTSGQGFAGGNSTQAYRSGGGGGAGGAGVSSPNQPNGGPGVIYPTMSPYYFGGGGGGSSYSLSTGGYGGIGGGGGGAVGTTFGGAGLNPGSPGGGGSPNSQTNTPGGNAGANTGGGGGGGSHYNANNKGGDGGSGIIIVRYPGSQRASGGTVTFVAGHTIHTFTTSGTFTPNGAPGTGTIWTDFSNNGNSGTLTNGPTYNSANGGSFVFDGGNDYVDIGSLGSQFTNFTVEIWFKSDSVANYRNPIDCNWLIEFPGSYSNIGPRLEQNSSGTLGWIVGSGSNVYTGINVVPSGLDVSKYHYAAITKSSSTLFTSYYNGNAVTTTNFSNWTGSMLSVSVGRGFSASGERWFIGKIPSVKIYNRALSAAEIQQNYNATKSRYI